MSTFLKSPFCTFSSINPGCVGPWDVLWIFFLIVIFIILQRNAFGQNNFQISCTSSKVHFEKKNKNCQNGNLDLVHEI